MPDERCTSSARISIGCSKRRENQLTPWSNDPVTDRPGEVIFLRDEDTGRAERAGMDT